MILPCNWSVCLCPGFTATALVVQDELVMLRQVEHLGEEVAMIGTRAAVEDDQWRA